MKQALGMIETKGWWPCSRRRRHAEGGQRDLPGLGAGGPGLVTAFVEGDVAAVKAATDAGAEAAAGSAKWSACR